MLALGLISGTSADGVSAALIRLKSGTVILESYATYAYPAALRKKTLEAMRAPAYELSRLNFELGEFFAQSALSLLKMSGIKNRQISVIGSHGQTVYHGPQDTPRNTLQIAEPAVIAERTGIPVVADFRTRDVACGGEGAPLVPFFDWFIFQQSAPLLLLNIGGISNVTAVAKSAADTIGFDTGPGNCLLDLAVSFKTRGRMAYDAGGALAYKGKADEKAIQAALKHPYFKRRPPKSTGRELFDQNFLRKYFSRVLSRSLPDACATLAAFTADSISQAHRDFIRPRHAAKQMYVSGGGANNVYLMSRLGMRLSPIELIGDDGIPAQAKEPMAFALMALMAVQGKNNHLPKTTGAKDQRILGAIYPA